MLPGILSILAAAVLAGVDQLIKAWATAYLLPRTAITIWPGVLEFRYFLNDGMAFSMLSGKQTLLIVVTSVMLLGLCIYLLLRKMPLLERIAWAMVVGGGVGNLIDRVLNGAVVDFINPLFVNFAVFNFADICVTVGIGLLILSILLEAFRDRKKPPHPKAEPEDGNV